MPKISFFLHLLDSICIVFLTFVLAFSGVEYRFSPSYPILVEKKEIAWLEKAMNKDGIKSDLR